MQWRKEYLGSWLQGFNPWSLGLHHLGQETKLNMWQSTAAPVMVAGSGPKINDILQGHPRNKSLLLTRFPFLQFALPPNSAISQGPKLHHMSPWETSMNQWH